MSDPARSFDAARHYQVDAVADEYERVRFGHWRGAFVHARECRLILRALRAAGGVRTVLDLPAGTGRLQAALRRAGYHVVGADISAAMLRHARTSGDSVFVRADGRALPLRPNGVDAVVCLRLMSHLPEDVREAWLAEMARVARVALVVVYQPHKLSLWYLVRNRLQRQPLPRYYASPQALAEEFSRSGLKPVASFALLPGVFMERAYVLVPKMC